MVRKGRRRKRTVQKKQDPQMELLFPLSSLDSCTLAFIQYKARQVSRRAPFTPSDKGDIEQDLALDLMMRSALFNRSKGCWRGFVLLVVDNKIHSMVQARKTRCRDYRLITCSLDEELPAGQGEKTQRHEIVSTDRFDPRFREKEDARDLAIDMADALKALPADLQSLCLRLQRESITDIARDMGVHRDRIYRLISQARAHLIERGLNEYVHRQPTQGENS